MQSVLQVFRTSISPLPLSEIADIHRAPPEEKLSSLPPCRPKAGHLQLSQQPHPQMFVTVYHISSRHATIEWIHLINKTTNRSMTLKINYTSCQYRWVNNAVRKLPKKQPVVKKTYFQVDTPNGPCSEFVKHSY